VIRHPKLPTMKKTILATLLAAVSATTLAADFYVVVPVKNRTATIGNIQVTLGAVALPRAVAGRPYAGFDFSSVLQVKGDPNFVQAGVTWRVVGGALPAGLALSPGGKLTGTPSAPGTSSFQVMASYKTKAGQQAFQVVAGEVSVSLERAAMPAGVQGAAYFVDLKPRLAISDAPGFDMADVTWNYVGALPPGLTLRTNGTITGVPSAEGTHPVTVRATYLGKSGQQTYEVFVGAITVGLASAALPAGVQGAAYRYDLKPHVSVAGDAAYAVDGTIWSLASGTLPAGLTLSADGVIAGTPTDENASTPFTVRVAYKTKTGEQAYSVLVGAIEVSLARVTPPGATYGQAYTSWDIKPNVSVAGDAGYDGKGTLVTWTLAGGALPPGLTLGSNGIVTGTPTGAGTNPVLVKAQYKGKSATQSYTLSYTSGIAQFTGYRAWSDGTLAANCKEYRSGKPGYASSGATGDGYYRIDVDGPGGATGHVDVLCDMTTDGGGWTVIQRRVNGTVDFYRTYAEYAVGFGTDAEYWIGNNRLAVMTAGGANLRIDMQRYTGETAYAQYNSFTVAPASDGYRMTTNWVGGTAGDSLSAQNGYQFTTKDVDQDTHPDNCAVLFKGAWWYTTCHSSNLNGAYLNGPHESYADGVEWYAWTQHYESLTKTEMKIR
jgi:hypothetical protein